MYIEPNTIIKVLKGCPLDPTYDHTLWFDDKNQQAEYFSSLTKYNITKQTYQRVQRGVMRVNINAEQLYDCNYVMFQNTAFGSTRWFYAFIKGVEFVNNVTSEITLEIDVMQTWMFDYEMQQCFVEREHSVTDNIGDNTVPESLEQGPYISIETKRIRPKNFVEVGGEIIVITTFDQSDSSFPQYTGRITNGVYCGLYIGFYETASELQTMIKLWQSLPGDLTQGIVSVYMCPFDKTVLTGPQPFSDVEIIPKNYDNLDGYVPKNKKLFTYPYNLLHIYNDQGCADFRYEQFRSQGNSCGFAWRENVIPEPVISLIPVLYGEPQGEQNLSFEERLTSTYYPQCAFNTDVYKQFLARNAASLPTAMNSMANQAMLGVTNAFVGAITTVGMGGNPAAALAGDLTGTLGTVIGYADSVAKVNAMKTDISSKPPQMNGTQSSAADYSLTAKEFRYKKLTIKSEYARIIDDYFNVFGYATHRIKVPNRNSRPHWNYVKTVGCVVKASVPADDISKICTIYNNGITFWKNADEIGNYSLNNSPT